MKKRIISLALILILAFSLLPAGILAADSEYTDVYQGSGYYITAKKFGKQDIDYYHYYDVYFSDGLLKCRDSAGNTCYLDKDGNVVISGATLKANGVDESYNFSEGMCLFSGKGETTSSGYTPTRYGYIDKTGKVVLQQKYNRPRDILYGAFHDGLALVEIEGYYHDNYYIDKNGKIILDDSRYFHTNFDGGKTVYAKSELNSNSLSGEYIRFHIIDISGKTLATYSPVKSDDSPAFFHSGCSFSEGYAVIYSPLNMLDVIDTDGDLVLRLDEPLESGHSYDFVMDLPEFSGVHGGILIYSVGRSSHVDNKAIEISSGRSVFPEGKTYTYIYDNFSDGVVSFDDDSRGCGLVDSNGFEVVPPKEFDDISPFNEGMGLAERGREYYILEKHNGTWSGPLPQDTDQTEQPPVPTPPTTTPTTSEPSSWAKASVAEAVSANIVPGTLQSAYTSPTTRAEFCALATQLYETVKGEITTRAEFTDTSDVNVQKMASLGVVNGVGNGKFNPDGTLTREQAATMLARLANAMGKPLSTASANFADNSSVSSWALEAVGQMQSSAIMSGVGSNKFDPKGSYTREQSIITALRLYNIVK